MKKILLSLTFLSCFSLASAEVVFKQGGYAIAPLDAKPGNAESATSIMMFLPPKDGFAPNVNVQIQTYAESMDEYIKLSKQQFVQLGATVVSSDQPSGSEWIVEYTANMGGNDLHFYSRALKKGNKIYLATATCPEATWSQNSRALMDNVKSLRLVD